MRLRFLSRLLIIFLLAALTWIPALADVIWEPSDSFYEQHREDCVYNNRHYTANGKDGVITVVKEPVSNEAVASVNNGNTFFVSFTYTDKDGAEWGVVEFNPDGSGNLADLDYSTAVSGWVRMTDMTVVYDDISFAEDHQSEFEPYTGNYEEFKNGEPVTFWSYPGSGVVAWEEDAFERNDFFQITETFTDTDGRLWGYIGYYYGARNIWVCISDPSGAGIEKAQPTPIGSQTPPSAEASVLPNAGKEPGQDNQTPMLFVIIAIVAAVVIVTAVLIAVFWKKSTKKEGAVK
jgi:hypothetical protein